MDNTVHKCRFPNAGFFSVILSFICFKSKSFPLSVFEQPLVVTPASLLHFQSKSIKAHSYLCCEHHSFHPEPRRKCQNCPLCFSAPDLSCYTLNGEGYVLKCFCFFSYFCILVDNLIIKESLTVFAVLWEITNLPLTAPYLKV